jgi:BlaI family transcriptional regulator, penicillinase repressor
MRKDRLPKPSERELEILRVLWERGASTVREVHEILDAAEKRGYTTTLKFMQIMAEKGLAVRDESPWAHVYEAGVSEEAAHRRIVTDLLDRAFAGSAQKLVLQALSAKKASPEEIREIRRVLDEMEGGGE